MLTLQCAPSLEQLADSWHTQTVNLLHPLGPKQHSPPRIIAGLRNTNGYEDAVNAHHIRLLQTLKGVKETAPAANGRVLLAVGQDAHVGIRDGASDNNVQIPGSDCGCKAA